MKKIVIIGASSGIGNRVARDFAAAGWNVAVAARREEPLRKLADEFPDNVVWGTFDVTQPDCVNKFYNLIDRNEGADVVLIASGVGFQNPGLDETKDSNIIDVNCGGFARIAAAAFKFFARTRGGYEPGRIAAITSVAGTKGIGVAAAYSASKRFQQEYLTALEQLANAQDANIRFTDIRPGFIRTDLLDSDTEYPLEMTLDYAAPLVEAAILKGKRVAVVDWRWRMINAAWRLIPRRLWVNMSVNTAQ